MQVALTAPKGACQSSVLCCGDTNTLGLQARTAQPDNAPARKRDKKLRIVAMAGFGALALGLSFVSAQAVPLQPHPTSTFDPKAPVETQIVTSDPLEAISPVEPAEFLTYAKLSEQFVVSLPLTNPPAAEGEADDEIDVMPTEHMEFEDMRVPVWIVDTILRASK